MTMGQPEEERQRKVRFHGRVQFKTIRHVADFSEDEITAGWYCKKDFMRMSDEVAEIAKLLTKGQEFYNGEELCIRGLEHLVEEDVADYRAEKMIASIDAVLDEQDEQMESDIRDPAMIAKIYSDIVTPLLREAYLVGLRDAKEGAAAAALIPDLSVSEIQIQDEGDNQPQALHDDSDGEQQPQGHDLQEEAEMLGVQVNDIKPSDGSVESCDDKDESEAPIDEDGDDHVLEDRTTQEETSDDKMDTVQAVDTSEMEDFSGSEQTCDLATTADEGEEKLNTSVNSMTMEAHPDKTSMSKIPDSSCSKAQHLKQGLSATSLDNPQKSPPRKLSRRKNFDRKSGTEMSPFVFRRDGTIGFRNYDVEHRKREQSKQRKDCVQTALFSFLDDDAEEDEEFARFIAKSDEMKKEKRSKLYAASFPSKSKTKAKPSSTRTTANEATLRTTSLLSHPQSRLKNDNGSNHSAGGVHGSMSVQKKNAFPQAGWSKIVAKDKP